MEPLSNDEAWKVPDEELARNKEIFREFLETQFDDSSYYRDLIDNSIENNTKRILINLDHLRAYDQLQNRNISKMIVLKPREFLDPLQDAVREFARYIRLNAPKDFNVGITGPIGDHCVSPRNLSSRFLSHIVCLDGIVTKTSLVNPKLLQTVQYCEKTNQFHRRVFKDATNMNELPTRMAIPTEDADGNKLEVEFGYCEFIDHQIITVQERPESAPTGQMPRSCDVIADRDLADVCKPGDRVKIYGVYRVLTNRVQGVASGIYRAVLVANSIEVSAQAVQYTITPTDVANIKTVASRPDIVDLLGRSLAPSICGHEMIKKALVLMLVGGNECNLQDGTHIRGDVNVLMVGDPSTAKSQLLRHVMNIAPLAVHTTGRGSSGVGLTASVSSDPETGERKLEAGAMVIADRGVVCIDEFDKMDEIDRVSIHEALEQQTVTISKAGIHATLNARCSVVAAANPIWGTYNTNKSAMENIGLPDSLISRFDLLFIVLDHHDPLIDSKIADHVLRSHKWRGQVTESGNGVFVQPDSLLHGSTDVDYLTIGFIKKYISHVKQIQPELQQEAIDQLVQEWSDLRAIATRKTQPITPRTFETLIRLSTASAKLRMSNKIEIIDAKLAISMLRFSIFGEHIPSKDQRKRKSEKKEIASTTEVEESSTDNDSEPEPETKAPVLPVKSVAKDVIPEPVQTPPPVETNTKSLEDKRKAFMEVYKQILDQTDQSSLKISEFAQEVFKRKHVQITHSELTTMLKELEQNGTIMLDGEDIIFI